MWAGTHTQLVAKLTSAIEKVELKTKTQVKIHHKSNKGSSFQHLTVQGYIQENAENCFQRECPACQGQVQEWGAVCSKQRQRAVIKRYATGVTQAWSGHQQTNKWLLIFMLSSQIREPLSLPELWKPGIHTFSKADGFSQPANMGTGRNQRLLTPYRAPGMQPSTACNGLFLHSSGNSCSTLHVNI